MSGSTVRREDAGGVALLTLDRPPVNALARQLVDDLNEALAALENDDRLRAAIVTGAGKNFCAGADLKERQGMSEDEVRAWVPYLNGAFHRLASLPVPTIAAINGVAAGGGFELALACDLRILESGGRVGLPETSLAILPGAGGTQRLPRLIGPSKAKRWIFTAALYEDGPALADGAVDLVAPPGRLLDEARALAARMAANAPLAIRRSKEAIDAGAGRPLHEGLRLEIDAYAKIIPTEDRREALASFREKRPPVWKGR